VNLSPALDTFTTCQKCLGSVHSLFRIESKVGNTSVSYRGIIFANHVITLTKFLDVTMDDLAIEAGRASEKRNVTYCNLLLRPLFIANGDTTHYSLLPSSSELPLYLI
jgi:hypothetical protein